MVDTTTNEKREPIHSKPSNSSRGPIKQLVSIVGDSYEKLIEAGKRKLGYYSPEVTDHDRFLMSFLIYFTALLMVVFVADYLAQKTYEDSDSLGPLQQLEVEIVYIVQKDIFDMPVSVNRTSHTIWYQTDEEWNGQNFTADEKIGGFGLEIDSVCTGFHEMVFLGVLVMGFRGVPVKQRVKWTAILLAIVFVENLFRIFALYPLALYKGRDFEEWFHFYWWHYGQYLFIMGLFGLWFFFVARHQINPDEFGNTGRKEKEVRPEDGVSEKPEIEVSGKPATEELEGGHEGMQPDKESVGSHIPPMGSVKQMDDVVLTEVEPNGPKTRDPLDNHDEVDDWWKKWHEELSRI